MNPKVKFLLRWTLRLFLVFIVLLVIAYLSLDTVARKYAESEISRQTGLVTKIDAVRIGIFHPGLTVKNFRVYNSAAFGGSPLISLPELHIEYDLYALANNKFHSRLVRFNLTEVNIVQDQNGRKNLDEVGRQMEKSAKQAQKNRKPGNKHNDDLQFAGIDKLELTLGTARYVQLKEPALTNEFKLNINHQLFYHINSEQDFSGVLLAALLKSSANVMGGGSNNVPSLLELLNPQAR